MSDAVPNLEQIKAAMRAQWMAGDFGVVAQTIAGAAETFVESLALAPNSRVLDVACGTGNLAIPLARGGSRVTGVDIAANLLAQARTRAAAEHLTITFDEGDAEQLPYPDGSFDVVVSMFGAMFAPRPEVVARELARVLNPGGLLAMANWNPESFSGAMFRVNARHAPPPQGLEPPVLWGDTASVRKRLSADFDEIRCERIPMLFDLPTNAPGAVAFFRRYFGPTQMAFARLDESAQQRFTADLEALWAGANTAEDPEDHVVIPNEYLKVLARRRAIA